MKAQSFQTSINGYTVGDTCIDLYAEQIMIPRILLLSAMKGLLVLALFLIRCHRRRHARQLKRWFAYFLAMTVTWLTIFLCCFNSSIAVTTSSMSGAQGDGFDIVYVIIPRMYRDKIVEVPPWLLDDNSTLNRTEFRGITFATGTTPYHAKLRLVVLDTDFGPASKVLGTLLIEHDPDTLIVYGDDDRLYPPQLWWISAEDGLYCGRSLAVGVNSVSFVGGAGGVVVQRKFFGMEEMSAFQVANMSKACYLGDDYYLSHLLSSIACGDDLCLIAAGTSIRSRNLSRTVEKIKIFHMMVSLDRLSCSSSHRLCWLSSS
ncbi:unnamed protein product [Peronospora farinosa]|uniref:Uncharacterized protein n=1 Tax=Peronospora farinosa TaxID=134698 RepID=A0AAV0TUB4_9STRA|nr:unnamed protein product [Peronospora farinosa]